MISLHLQYLYSLMRRQRERRRYLGSQGNLPLPIILLFLYISFEYYLCQHLFQCYLDWSQSIPFLSKGKDVVMEPDPLTPHSLGHRSVIYFWKLFRISFYKVWDIIQWMSRAHGFPTENPWSLRAVKPLPTALMSVWNFSATLFLWDYLGMTFLLFAFSSKRIIVLWL